MRTDNIQEIIWCMNVDERREFQNFLQGSNKIRNRRDVELFKILCKKRYQSATEITMELYGNENSNAYHSVRKVVQNKLIKFIAIQQLSNEHSLAVKVQTIINTGQWLLENERYDAGNYYLKKAQRMSKENNFYLAIMHILNLQILYSDKLKNISLNKLITKRNEYKRIIEDEEAFELTSIKIKKAFTKMKQFGVNSKSFLNVNRILKQYYNNSTQKILPKRFTELLDLIRAYSLSNKQYLNFEKIVTREYRVYKRDFTFSKKDHFYKLKVLYMICHAMYRNRNFKNCKKFLQEFETAINAGSTIHYNSFYPKLILIRAAVLSYEGQNTESIALISNALQQNHTKLQGNQVINMKINLAVYYFQSDDFKECKKTLFKIGHSEGYLQKLMGQEWLIRKSLIEIINAYELNDMNEANKKIKYLKKNFKKTLANPIYMRVTTFLGFIKDCIKKPEWVSTQEYFDHVNSTLERWPIESEDIQAMAFYCWLKSKMLKKRYYEVLVDTVKKEWKTDQ